jgi:hypothetical protein
MAIHSATNYTGRLSIKLRKYDFRNRKNKNPRRKQRGILNPIRNAFLTTPQAAGY